MKQRIEKWKQMETTGDPNSMAYLQQITDEAKAEGKLQELNDIAQFLLEKAENRISTVETSIHNYTVFQQLGDLTEAINLAYIARNYFGKSRQWLYQKVKGLTVNGKKASFTADEELVFINALNDVSTKITAFTSR